MPRLFVILGFLFLVSCGEPEVDTSLQKEYDDLSETLETMERDLELVRKKIAEIETPDPAGDLAEMAAELETVSKEREILTAKAEKLKVDTEVAKKRLIDYQAKYPVRNE